MALKLYCCTTANDGKTKQEWVYEHKHKILRDSSILSLSLSVLPSLLTCVVLVLLEDKSKHLGQFVERVFVHAIHPAQESPPIDFRIVLLPVQAPRLMNNLTRYPGYLCC